MTKHRAVPPSRVAVQRAIHQLVDEQPKILVDPRKHAQDVGAARAKVGRGNAHIRSRSTR
jgi:hypothetical protein